MERRREALGRNRQGPDTRNLVPTVVVFAALLGGLGWFAYDYFTTAQRVLGAKTLDCPAHEITWQKSKPVTSHTYVIEGCGKSLTAECPPKSPCLEADTWGDTF